MQPLIARGVSDEKRMLAIVTNALFVPNDADSAEERRAFAEMAETRIAEAMQPPKRELSLEIEGRVEKLDETTVTASVNVRTSPHDGAIATTAKTAGATEDGTAERAVSNCVRATLAAMEKAAERAETIATNEEETAGEA